MNYQLGNMSHHKKIFVTPSLTKKRQKTKVPHTEPQTKESVPTPSNDPLPSEKAKTSEVKKIVDLKKRVKKLERKKKSRTSGLKRLWKEDASKQGRMINNIDQDVEITLVGETQGRMNEEDMFGVDYLDCDEVIMDATAGKEVEKHKKVAKKEVSTASPVTTAGEVVTTVEGVKVTTAATTLQISKDELTLA
nr:hypothetical protein [Tanacetum cinerariifolium]